MELKNHFSFIAPMIYQAHTYRKKIIILRQMSQIAQED